MNVCMHTGNIKGNGHGQVVGDGAIPALTKGERNWVQALRERIRKQIHKVYVVHSQGK